MTSLQKKRDEVAAQLEQAKANANFLAGYLKSLDDLLAMEGAAITQFAEATKDESAP